MNLPRHPSNEDIYPEPISHRIVIDPEKLIRMKKQRQPFRMVKSRFEPENAEPVLPLFTDPMLSRRRTAQSDAMGGYQSNSNIAVVSSLVSIEFNQLFRFEEAEDIPLDDQQTVWLCITGEIKLLLSNRKCFHAHEGFMFFLSEGMRRHVLEATAEKSTVLLKLSRSTFMNDIMPYFNAKNEELVGWLSSSPYLSKWPLPHIEDIATVFELQRFEKNSTLYVRQEQPQFVYLLREGVILLERSVPLRHNCKAFEEYEQRHQMNSSSDSDNTLVVRKSMIFGIDGTLLKHGRGRVYQCRAMSKCEVYAIRSQLFEAFASRDILIEDSLKQYRSQQVVHPVNEAGTPSPAHALADRNSLQYSSVLTERMRRNCTPEADAGKRPLKPTSFSLRFSQSVDLVKRTNVENILKHELKVRKISILSPARSRTNKSCLDSYAEAADGKLKPSPKRELVQQHLPSLALKNPVEQHIYKALQRQNEVMRTVEFRSFKERVNQRLSGNSKDNKASLCVNILAYRNIVSGSQVVRNRSKSKAETPNPEKPLGDP